MDLDYRDYKTLPSAWQQRENAKAMVRTTAAITASTGAGIGILAGAGLLLLLGLNVGGCALAAVQAEYAKTVSYRNAVQACVERGGYWKDWDGCRGR